MPSILQWFLTQLRDLLFGLGILDAVFLLGLYVIGSYLVIDMPINIATLALATYACTTKRDLPKRALLFATVAFATTLTVGGLALFAVPRSEPTYYDLLYLHWFLSKFLPLLLLPYLATHVRIGMEAYDRSYRAITVVGWMLLKLSLWSGVFFTMFLIGLESLEVHTVSLGLAVPVVTLHIAWPAHRRRVDPSWPEVDLPISVRRLGTPHLFVAACIAGLLPVAGTILYPTDDGRRYLDTVEEISTPGELTLEPSPMRAEPSGVRFREDLLADSSVCGNEQCHPSLLLEWTSSPHRRTVTELYRAEVEAVVCTQGLPAARICAGCHDPISLLAGYLEPGRPLFSPEGIREGVSCIVCHRLFPQPGSVGNASLVFRFPPHYFAYAMRDIFVNMVLIGLWEEHRFDFREPGFTDDRQCIACHRLQEATDPRARDVGAWLSKAYHDQKTMIPACRGDEGCLHCHMPKTTVPGVPGPPEATHRFTATASVAEDIDESSGTGAFETR